MNLYLFNQKRNRDLNEYLDKLCISTEDFLSINSNEKKYCWLVVVILQYKNILLKKQK